MKNNFSFFALIVVFMASCLLANGQQRCSVDPCTSAYCVEKWPDTWNSSENFDNYGYTKLTLANNSCLPCSYNCLKCTSQTSCQSCATSYYEETPKCNLCNDRCLVCEVVNSINRCYQCQIGSYLDTLDENCKSCPQGAYQCTSYQSIVRCKTGYRQQNSLFCAKCPDNCLTCNLNSSQCQRCDTGYMLNTTSKKCVACNSNCQKCTLFQSKAYCTLCATSYIAVSGACSSCPSNCEYCTSVTVCGRCKEGYNIVGGGCQAVSASVKYCISYNGATCSKCKTGFYVQQASNKCYPCSLTCLSCYGRHFGNCYTCNSVANLFNQMCIVINFPTRTTYQGYYAFPYAASEISSGSLGCNGYFYSGQKIVISLNDLASGLLTVQWKLYTIASTASYTAAINSVNNTFTSQSNSFTFCGQQYYLSIQNQIFNDIKQNNTLQFSAIGGVQLALQQLIYTALRCNDLCLQCTGVLCTKCLTPNLYTQDAYCVYSCSNGYYTYEIDKTCIKQCPLGTYPRSTDQSCQACTSPCYSCSSDIFCLSCISGYYLSSGGQCVQTCPKLYYGKIQTKTCESCVGNCYECLNEIQCINCRIGFFYAFNKSCIDNCSSVAGYYSNVPNLTCQTCSSNCFNCSQSANKCTSCQSGKVIYNFYCDTNCPDNFFNSSGVCTLCTYPCQNCLSETLCLSCLDRYLLNNTCLVSCPNGYYEDNVKLTCQVCDLKCSKCLFSSNNCLQCSAGYFYYDFTCYSNCPNGYYGQAISKICLPCTGLCWQCSNQTSCQSCYSNFLLNGNCIGSSSCGKGLYADINSLDCKVCSSICQTCSIESTLCTSCYANSSTPYLQNSTCVNSCFNDYLYVSSQRMCIPCSAPCQRCLNQSACLSCITGYKYSSFVCSSQCSVGTFFNAEISECQACSNNCLICNSATFCQLCANSFYIQSSSSTEASCVSSCPNLYYGDFLTSSCQRCLYPCQNCQSSVDCVSCQTGVLYSKRCIGNCPDSTFLVNNTCIQCAGNCLTCQISATTCKICKDGFYLKGTECLSACTDGYYAEQFTKTCQICPSTCSKCLNNTYCTECILNKSFMGPSNICIENCPSGQYGDNITNSCKSCDAKCLTCSGTSTNCLSCSSNYLLVRYNNLQFDCKLACPDYYYSQGSVCYACIFPCQKCSSSISCLSCVNGTLFYAESNFCLSTCPLKTYQNSGVCQPCQSPCVNCLNNTYCLSCDNGLLYNGNCVSQCPSNYYADDTGICNECYGFCKTCSSKYNCLTCNAGYAYNGYCYSSCPPSTYGNSYTGACLACSSPCLQCSASANYCTRCMNNQFAYKGRCSDSCPQTTFVSSRQCISCIFPCLTCIDQYTCSSCVGGYLLYLNKTCITLQDGQNCPNDYYKKDSVACVPLTWCPLDYYIDQVLRTCSKNCSRDKYTDADNKKCVYYCPQNYYVGQNLICKDPTVQPPASLLQMKAISFIKSSKTHIQIQFSQSVEWLEKPSKAYSFTPLQSRLLSILFIGSNFKVYMLTDTQFQIALMSLPYKVNINLPAYFVKSALTSLPLQNPNTTIRLPDFQVYKHDNLYTGQIMGQLSEGVSWLILLLSFIFLFINRLSDIYILWDTAQLLYILLYLEIQYPPSLNEFFLGLQNTHLNFIPTLFSPSAIRNISDRSFYAYSYDNNFLRTAGHSVLIIIVVLAIYILLKICQLLIKKVTKINEFMKNYPKIKRFIYRGLLRFRWHHASDLFFITYLNVLMFGVAQTYFIRQNPNRIPSNVLCIILCIIYILFPIFVGYKLYKHYHNISKGKNVNNLKCFYRGIQKQNRFGVSMIILRYIRKMIYSIIIAIFSSMPMYALPILMFTSVMLGLFIFLNRPFKKRLSNIVSIFTEVCLVIVFILIALVQFLKYQLSSEMKQSIGWICSVTLTIALLILIFQIFCKTLFYLQPQSDPKSQPGYDPLKDEAYIRKKAGQFFDSLMPQLREHFNLDDSQDQIHQYQEGDSQDSQNNDLRQRGWGIQSQNSSSNEQFKHYGQSSQGGELKQNSGKKIPNYLIRCVKDLK